VLYKYYYFDVDCITTERPFDLVLQKLHVGQVVPREITCDIEKVFKHLLVLFGDLTRYR